MRYFRIGMRPAPLDRSAARRASCVSVLPGVAAPGAPPASTGFRRRGGRWLAVLIIAATSPSCATVPSAPIVTPAGVRFSFTHAAAKSVALSGTFNGWSISSHPLSRTGASGVWTVAVALPPGEHLFMYVVDGTQWITPPLAEDFADDGFGARNGIVVVKPDER